MTERFIQFTFISMFHRIQRLLRWFFISGRSCLITAAVAVVSTCEHYILESFVNQVQLGCVQEGKGAFRGLRGHYWPGATFGHVPTVSEDTAAFFLADFTGSASIVVDNALVDFHANLGSLVATVGSAAQFTIAQLLLNTDNNRIIGENCGEKSGENFHF